MGIAWGTFKELKMSEERREGMQQLFESVVPLITGETTISHSITDGHDRYIEAMKGVVYRIKLTKKTGRYEKR